jgi:hypothetical protein
MIITYTSSQVNPIANQADKIIDLAQVSLPQTSIQLYGAAQDSSHPSASFFYSWSLSKPEGSSASLSSETIQNPILNNVDTWGNYRLFLIATNTSTGETSQTDAVIAPQTAFVHVRVKSESKGLEKPCVGERNWHNTYHDLIDSVENATGGGGATTFEQLTDVDTTGKAQGKYVRYDEATSKFTMQDADPIFTIPPALADLTDVSISGATEGQVLVKGATDWIAQDLSSGATKLNDLSDCANVSSYPQEGQVLTYSSMDGWVNSNIPTPPSQNLNVSANDTILPLTIVDLAQDKLSFHGTSGEIDITRSKVDNDVRITMSLPTSISANASTATKLATPRTIAISGAVSGSASFDGSESITINTSSNITLPTQYLTFSQQSTTTLIAGTKDINNPNISTIFNEGTLSKDFTDEIALHPHLIWRNNTGSSIKITYIDLVVFSGGSQDGGTTPLKEYTFDLVRCVDNAQALIQNAWTSVSATITAQRSSNVTYKNHRPMPASLDTSSSPITIADGEYFGIRVLTHPYHHGYGLSGTITAYIV